MIIELYFSLFYIKKNALLHLCIKARLNGTFNFTSYENKL